MTGCRVFIWCLMATTLSAAPAASQSSRGTSRTDQGSRYISMESGLYEAIAGLRQRGLLAGVDPLAQPYRRDEIARAISSLSPATSDTLPAHVARWLRVLRAELAPELNRLAGRDSVIMGFDALVDWKGSTSNRMDPLLPTRDTAMLRASEDAPELTYRGWFSPAIGGWAEYGRFASEIRLFYDRYLCDGDPEGACVPGIAAVGRTDNAYLSASFANGSVFVGRMRRNWAPLGSGGAGGGGLMLSAAPPTYPHLGLELGGTNVVVRSVVAELDTIQGQDRYFIAHYIEYRREDFAISIGEAKVYVSASGLRLASVNPVDIFFFSQDGEPGEITANTVVNGQLWLRRGRWTLFGEGLLDDIHVQQSDPAPVRGALSGGVRFAGRRMEVGADYRVVSAFAYWTFGTGNRNNVDQWSRYGRGLGDNASDYDRLSLHASVYPVAGLRLTPTLAVQRKGEWDFRMPAIPYEEFRTKTPLFYGTRETIVRPALAGRYEPSRRALVEWDAGVNFVDNASHISGRSLTEFSGSVRVLLNWSAPGIRGR
jgi:hypothetical protein